MIEKLYEKVISRYKKELSFIVLISFILTFVLARMIIYLIDANLLPDIYLSMGQTHVHHLNYGIFVLSIAGYLSLISSNKKILEKVAILYGIGLGLTFDEFSLWLHLQDNYYARISYEAIIIIIALLINIVYFGDLWKKILMFIFKKPLSYKRTQSLAEKYFK